MDREVKSRRSVSETKPKYFINNYRINFDLPTQKLLFVHKHNIVFAKHFNSSSNHQVKSVNKVVKLDGNYMLCVHGGVVFY